MLKKVQTPHARFLYLISQESGKDWQSKEVKLAQFVSQNGIQFQDETIGLFYFLPPSHDDFLDTPVWVGRHVVSPSLGAMNNETFASFDLYKGEAFEVEIGQLGDLGHLEIFDKVNEIYKANNGRFGNSWRLLWQKDKLDGTVCAHFFPPDQGESTSGV